MTASRARTLETDSGRRVRLRQHVTPIRTDTTLALWSGGVVRAFPVDIDGLIDDDTADELDQLGLLVGKEDREAVVAALRGSARRLFEDGRDAVLRTLAAASTGGRPAEILELGGRTGLLAGERAGWHLDRLDDALPGLATETAPWRQAGSFVESGLPGFARPAGYDQILLVQRPLWPVGSRSELIALVRGLARSLRAGGEFWGYLDRRWPGADLVAGLNADLEPTGYSTAVRLNRLTGLRELVLHRLPDRPDAPTEVEILEQACTPPVPWLVRCFEAGGGWDELRGFDEELNPVALEDPGPGGCWIRARRTEGEVS